MKNCRRDARPEIVSITVDWDTVETWGEGSTVTGIGTLAAGQSIVRTTSASHTFTRKFLSDFFGKHFYIGNFSGVDRFADNTSAANCDTGTTADFSNTASTADKVLLAGDFCLWSNACCPCRITIDCIPKTISGAVSTVFDGFGAPTDGTTTSAAELRVPQYLPKHCRIAVPEVATVTPASPATWTITQAVTGSSSADAEQLITLNESGYIDGFQVFDWTSPAGDVFSFSFVPDDGEQETRTRHAALPTLWKVNGADPTSTAAADFQITLENGSAYYGTFRIAFVGKFARTAVNAITARAIGGANIGISYTTTAPAARDSDQIYFPGGSAGNVSQDVLRCMGGDGWEYDATYDDGAGFTRTGSITWTFNY